MQRRRLLALSAGALATPAMITAPARAAVDTREQHGYRIRTYGVRAGSGSRDVACNADGTVWFCGQRDGTLNLLDPRDGGLKVIPLGPNAAPHGVVIGPDGAAWVTEGGQNAIARVDARDHRVRLWKLPAEKPSANLNTLVFDTSGILWFTGQSGIIGRFEPAREHMQVWDAPRGYGPYGITRTPQGTIWYVSLAGNHLAQIDLASGTPRLVEPPTPQQGARRVWSDSQGRLWISEWNSGNVSRHDPRNSSWKTWKLPGERPRCYSVYVDDRDAVWLTDFAANAIVRFDPSTETFLSFPSDKPGANVRQMAGRPGEAWGGESGTNRIVVIDKPVA
ncbi:SMP-30/gluconolactonase/LRE family protein [Reyranella sp. CPCC 100927]|uniref:Vgb family protein n=1 Tax=Reyranella sp. CPCC 100927 TaxID=2599616 RepID=UPI0011B73CEF|nr:SMP-30/gluconolactonase/LRE family protein [Reyranella sp. CPCC 100927]TWS94695.1 lyase [Reyranella sp. CPCC 100927]